MELLYWADKGQHAYSFVQPLNFDQISQLASRFG